MIEGGLYDDFKFFVEQIIECQIILNDLADNTEHLCNSDKFSDLNTKQRFEKNLHYMDIIDTDLNKIKEKCVNIIFEYDAGIKTTNNIEILQKNNILSFPLNKNDDIYVDLNYPLPFKDYLDKDKK